MKSYQIIVTPDAEADLAEIRDYIAYKLRSPETAIEYLEDLKSEIQKLSHRGTSIAPVPEEPWHSRGLRKVTAKKFYIYYLVREDVAAVFVMNVIYTGRDQIKALREKLNLHLEQ